MPIAQISAFALSDAAVRREEGWVEERSEIKHENNNNNIYINIITALESAAIDALG